jgi:hypothetical protein
MKDFIFLLLKFLLFYEKYLPNINLWNNGINLWEIVNN